MCARVQASPDVVAARRWRGLVAVEAGGASSSYIQQDRDEMEVLFTFLAERYERKSVVITSNLVLSAGEEYLTPNRRTRTPAFHRLPDGFPFSPQHLVAFAPLNTIALHMRGTAAATPVDNPS